MILLAYFCFLQHSAEQSKILCIKWMHYTGTLLLFYDLCLRYCILECLWEAYVHITCMLPEASPHSQNLMRLALGPGSDPMKCFPEIPYLTPLHFSLFDLLFQSSMHASVPCETGLWWSTRLLVSTDILNTLSILWCLAHLPMAHESSPPFLLMVCLEL